MKREDYVSLEAAKLLEEKDFNEPCNAIYIESPQADRSEFRSYITDDIKKSSGLPKIKDGCKYDTYLAPTLYEAQKWLRNRRKTYASALPTKVDGKTVWYYVITKDVLDDGIYGNVSNNNYNTYEEALSAGINEALKLI